MTSNTENTKWHVLLVRPRTEKKTGQRLREMGFEACVPTQLQYRQWSDRRKKVEVVLFNNYVFVATDSTRRNDVFLAGNILKYLSFSGHIAALSEKEASMIRQLGHLEAPIHITYESFQAGDEVEILSGSLAGYRGKIISPGNGSRLQLALPGLHCFAQVELSDIELRHLTI